MKKLGGLLLALFLAVPAAQAQRAGAAANLHFYAEPSAVVAFPGDFETVGGAALSVGVTVKQVHSFEADVMLFKSSYRGYDLTFVPVLAAYRYALPIAPNLALNLGGTAGFTVMKSESIRSSQAFTVGVVGGASYALGPQLSLEASVYALYVDNTRFTTSGTMELVTLGLHFRF